MDFFLKENKVFKNHVITPRSNPIEDDNVTLEINNIDTEIKDVYLGPNGVGKSFLWQSITCFACLYKKVHIRKQYEVIQRLADSKIGDVIL